MFVLSLRYLRTGYVCPIAALFDDPFMASIAREFDGRFLIDSFCVGVRAADAPFFSEHAIGSGNQTGR